MDYVSLTLGVLLSFSEVLPYIKSIQGNSIINILQKFITKQHDLIVSETETQQLLHEQPLESMSLESMSLELSKINNTLISMSHFISSEKKFTLKTPDEYQLIYIDNYLKTNFKKLEFKKISKENCDILKSLGYKIHYNTFSLEVSLED